MLIGFVATNIKLREVAAELVRRYNDPTRGLLSDQAAATTNGTSAETST